jgi:hypothetical protein
LKLEGEIYTACVQRVMVYGNEARATTDENVRRLVRTALVRWMCGVTLKDSKSTHELLGRLSVEDIVML